MMGVVGGRYAKGNRYNGNGWICGVYVGQLGMEKGVRDAGMRDI